MLNYDIALECTNEKKKKMNKRRRQREKKKKRFWAQRDSNLHSYFNWNV